MKKKKSKTLACPSCGSTDSLQRLEAVIAMARIRPDDHGMGWAYQGESKINWDSQGRELLKDRLLRPEFHCCNCDHDFNWKRPGKGIKVPGPKLKEDHQIDRYLARRVPVVLHHNNEAGVWQWSVVVATGEVKDDGFWFDSFPTKRAAQEFARQHGLEVLKVFDDRRKR